MAEASAELALALVPRVGPVAYHALVTRHGGAAAALASLPAGTRSDAEREARVVINRVADCGARVLTIADGDYPRPLLDLPAPPPVLFAIGGVAARGAAPSLAVVGTRDATAYGERVTTALAGAAARAGVTVVSGMARGIDARAHCAALDEGGHTVAVLGTGIDVPYPASHRALHGRIAAHGLVLSEHPPGTAAMQGSFPRRNRIIAALAEVTLVVEAGVRSGALITAGDALELGRTVAAVPGPIDAAQSAGTNELLRDGAALVGCAADLLALLGVSASAVPVRATDLVGDERIVWDALRDAAPDVDALAARAALPAHRCLAALTALELAGRAECALTGEVRRR